MQQNQLRDSYHGTATTALQPQGCNYRAATTGLQLRYYIGPRAPPQARRGGLLLNENSDMVRSATAPQASWSSRNLYQDS